MDFILEGKLCKSKTDLNFNFNWFKTCSVFVSLNYKEKCFTHSSLKAKLETHTHTRAHTRSHSSKQEADSILEDVSSVVSCHFVYASVNTVGVCTHCGILQVCLYLCILSSRLTHCSSHVKRV